MKSGMDVAPGIQIRGVSPPLILEPFRLLVLGMDSAMLYPGVQEFASACQTAGMAVNTIIGEAKPGTEKLPLLRSACESLGIEMGQAVVVGRASSDVAMMEAAGISIAFMASPEAAAAATVTVASGALDRILPWVSLASPQQRKDLDLSVLDTLVGHDPAKFRKFALLFIDSIETVLSHIDTAMSAHDGPMLMGMGHRAKSTAKSIGADTFSAQCLLLEQTARAGDVNLAIEIASGLRPQFNQIRDALQQRLLAST